MPQFSHAALGGTFDHFHNGHKRMIDFAFHVAHKVSIGITKEALNDKPFKDNIEPFEIRKEHIISYINNNHDGKEVELFTLTDIYGTTLEDKTIDAIVVTRETKPNALKINQQRLKNRLPALKIVTVPFVKGEDKKIIRSQRIRGGDIDRNGKSYYHLFNKQRALTLPPRLRELLRRPLGIIIEGEQMYNRFTAEKVIKWIERNKPYKVITVGDVVTNSLLENKYIPDLQIIDLRTQRKVIQKEDQLNKPSYKNPAGTIQRSAAKVLYKKLNTIIESKQKEKIVIQGEEDLLALPAMLLAPLNSVVIYGQTDMGVIIVPVTEALKYKVEGILRQFE